MAHNPFSTMSVDSKNDPWVGENNRSARGASDDSGLVWLVHCGRSHIRAGPRGGALVPSAA